MGLWLTKGSPNLAQKTSPYSNQQKKKENSQNCGLCCPGWPQKKQKMKEYEKKDKYLDLTREWKITIEKEGDNYTNFDWCFFYSN